MTTRRDFLSQSGALVVGGLAFRNGLGGHEPLVSADQLQFLRQLALDTIQAATKSVTASSQGFAFVTPGGNYPAFWIRDFSMGIGCGLIPPDTIRNHLKLLASVQSGPEDRHLKSGATIPAFAIPDHVDYDGKPVFYPGTYSSGEDQGGEAFGILPPVDDHYEFIHIAYVLRKQSRDSRFLTEEIQGIPLVERLARALDCPRTDPVTGLVVTDRPTRAVGFGFCDAVTFIGSLLFASLLRYRALGEMIEMGTSTRHPFTEDWRGQQKLIRRHLATTFEQDGWFIAATEVGRQPDVWGTVFALYLGVLDAAARRRALATVATAYKNGTITYKGAVRHVPTDHDFSATSAWQETGIPLNRYQNGAYWHVPSGWLIAALDQTDRSLASQLLAEMVSHFKEEDFRLGAGKGAPWECLHPDGPYRQNPVYMASITLPLEALTR